MNIREAIEQSGYKENFLAAKLGIDDAAFWQKKTGWRGRSFTSDERERLAEALGVSLAELFPEMEAETA